MATIHALPASAPQAAPDPGSDETGRFIALMYQAGIMEGERRAYEDLGVRLVPASRRPAYLTPVASLADHTAAGCSAILAASGPGS